MRTAAGTTSLAALVLLACWGCGDGGSKPYVAPTVPVKGKVTYKGQPVTAGNVMFEPIDIGKEAFGKIQPDGTFTLTSFKDGDGAVKGVHRVGVINNNKIPRMYRDPASSKTEVEVTEGKTDYTIDFK
jgi:hypothetical protein